MTKILMGLAAAVVIAVGGFFGFEFYTQHRIAGEVEAAFAQMRAGGGKAVDASDPAMRQLVAAGIDPLSADGDIGAEWTEAARNFVVARAENVSRDAARKAKASWPAART